jgi:hypothetical protein
MTIICSWSGCKLGHEAVDFQAVILARVFLLLWLRKRNFSENDQGKDPLINRVITKKSTASCQNLHPIILTSQSILLATILLFFQRDANLQDVEGRSQMWRVFPGIEASSSILQCKIPSFSAKSVRSSVNLPIPGRPPKKRAQVEAGVLPQLQAHDDATLEQHCDLWEQTHSERVSRWTMSRAIKRLGWTRKKVARGNGAQRGRTGYLASEREQASDRIAGLHR